MSRRIERTEDEERSREAAMVAAVGALRRRERTVAEMHAWLAGRDVDAEVVDEVVSDLIEVGELDDDRFAYAYAADKRDLSGWGPERIEAALVDRGLERSLAEAAAVEPHEQQLDRASELLASRFGQGAMAEEAERGRALALLARRGFDYELSYDAIRRAERS